MPWMEFVEELVVRKFKKLFLNLYMHYFFVFFSSCNNSNKSLLEFRDFVISDNKYIKNNKRQ